MSPERFVHYKLDENGFDDQHLLIFQLVDSIIYNIKTFVPVDADCRTLRVTLGSHFENELEEMTSVGYPFIKYHKTEHDKLLAVVDVLERSKFKTLFELNSFSEVFVSHVDFADRNYFEWRILNNKN
jgi:hemerythrin